MKIEVKSFKGDRFAVYDEAGNLLDDAQGYGYKTARNAHVAYAYKNRDKSKDAEKRARRGVIMKWLKEHSEFTDNLEWCLVDAMKCGEDVKTVDVVRGLLKEYETDFKPIEVVRVWEKM